MKPSPPYLGLLLASTGKLQSYAVRGYRLSPHLSYSEGNNSDDDELLEIAGNLQLDDTTDCSAISENA